MINDPHAGGGMQVVVAKLNPTNPHAQQQDSRYSNNINAPPPTTPEPEYGDQTLQAPQESEARDGPNTVTPRSSALSPVSNHPSGVGGSGSGVGGGVASMTSASPLPASSSGKAISIPTAGRMEEDEEEEEEQMTVAQRREKTMRDEQINQITALLAGAIVGNGK
jgi:hypothetical protein